MSFTHKLVMYIIAIGLLLSITSVAYFNPTSWDETSMNRFSEWTNDVNEGMGDVDEWHTNQPSDIQLQDTEFGNRVRVSLNFWKVISLAFFPLPIIQAQNGTWLELLIAWAVTFYWSVVGVVAFVQFIIFVLKNRQK